jgi:hypothetical protein
MKKILAVSMAIALAIPLFPAWAEEETGTATDSTAVTSTSDTAAASGETTDSILAATETETGEAAASEEAEDENVEEVEDLEGVEVEEITKVPSNFGLWWRSVRETLTLALTWDEMSKAEKALKFAEERMRIARLIAEQAPNDEKAQEKSQKMIEKAQRFMEKVEEKKDKWSKDKSQEEIDQLVGDITTHHSNTDVILDELEKKLPEDKAEALRDLREKRSETSQRLLNAISNENISAETKAHLEEVKARIEEHLEEVKQYNEQRQALQEQVKSGVVGAAEDLEALKEERQTQIQIRTESVAEIKTQLEEQAAAGDESAQKKLEIIEKVQERMQERLENQATRGLVDDETDTEDADESGEDAASSDAVGAERDIEKAEQGAARENIDKVKDTIEKEISTVGNRKVGR